MIRVAVNNRAKGSTVSSSAGRSTPASWAVLGLFVFLSLVGTLSARYGAPAADAAGRGILPPSSYAKAPQTQNTPYGDLNGLGSAPNPMDNAGNLVMTGNVSGGKSFRGPVPYNSTASFSGQLGSTSLDPFLRYSALPQDPGQDPSALRPFYSPTATVPRIQPDQSSVFAPGSPRIAVGAMPSQAEPAADNLPTPETALFQPTTGRTNVGANANAGTWQGWGSAPWAKTPEQMRQLVAGESGPAISDSGPSPQSKQLVTAEEYQRQMEQLQRDLDRVKTNALAFEQDLKTGRQPPLQTRTPGPGETAQPSSYSAEAFRRIIQPQSPAEPPADQDALTGIDGTSSSPGQSLTLWPPAGSSAGGWTQGGLGQTSRLVQGSPAVGQPALGQDRVGGGSPELRVVAPQHSFQGVPANTSPESRFRPYSPAQGLGPSPSDLAAQKSRINAIFRPQADPIPPEDAAPGRSQWDTDRALPPSLFSGGVPAPTNNSGGARPPSQYNPMGSPGPNPMNPAWGGTANTPGSPQRESSHPGSQSRVVNPQPPLLAPQTSPAVPPSGSPAAAPKPALEAPKPQEVVGAAPPDPHAQEKLNQYMTLAQTHMQQNQYARAAELFSLAAVYGPRAARPQLGRCQALLAAGEYLGSAVCLANAIEFDPRQTLQKADLVEILGGVDSFIGRITDLEQRAASDDAPGLQLLLAYVYQQMDRPEQARVALGLAKKGLPSVAAVDLLQAALGAPAKP
jgi:hypothetical protein